MSCKRFDFICRIVPFSPLRKLACRLHVDRCPECRRACSSPDELPPLWVTAEQLPAGLDLWPGINAAIIGPATLPAVASDLFQPARHVWRWALASGIAVLVLAAGSWFISQGRWAGTQPTNTAGSPAARITIASARIGNRPARVFLIQSRDPDRAIFWIAKDIPRS